MSRNPDINSVLGNKTKELRIRRKMTQEILAEKIGVSTRFLADVESGKTGISLTTLKNLCLALGTSADYLLDLEQDETAVTETMLRLSRIDQAVLPQVSQMIDLVADIYEKGRG